MKNRRAKIQFLIAMIMLCVCVLAFKGNKSHKIKKKSLRRKKSTFWWTIKLKWLNSKPHKQYTRISSFIFFFHSERIINATNKCAISFSSHLVSILKFELRDEEEKKKWKFVPNTTHFIFYCRTLIRYFDGDWLVVCHVAFLFIRLNFNLKIPFE